MPWGMGTINVSKQNTRVCGRYRAQRVCISLSILIDANLSFFTLVDQVTNGYVRCNAASLFFDSFPLENPEMNNEESDYSFQMQLRVVEVRLPPFLLFH